MTELDLLQFDEQHAQIQIIDFAITICGNKQHSIALANNFIFHRQFKYINIQHHYIRKKINQRHINFIYVFTKNMVVNNLTKPLFYAKYY